jgi:hypothetical protein
MAGELAPCDIWGPAGRTLSTMPGLFATLQAAGHDVPAPAVSVARV